ncbi:gastrula zinc finger protein XlCGF57.1-like [Achroia grisella]|uniref:gastrula zinc finger protein XlCGF57.1-like n=1 Tax=Achroia grisella TaxID=688607 RepID=UPI0027D3173A|nr:gastrula zinc finger protein XlCGF57.1-like [Achroia grisella]
MYSKSVFYEQTNNQLDCTITVVKEECIDSQSDVGNIEDNRRISNTKNILSIYDTSLYERDGNIVDNELIKQENIKNEEFEILKMEYDNYVFSDTGISVKHETENDVDIGPTIVQMKAVQSSDTFFLNKVDINKMSRQKNTSDLLDMTDVPNIFKFSNRRHLSTDTGEKPQCSKQTICYKCNQPAPHTNDSSFIYTGVTHYICDICRKCFKTKFSLQQHLIILHSGKKPYSCDVCEMSFPRSSQLENHMFLHTGKYPYTCNVCNKCFKTKNWWLQHVKNHTGEKPYGCDACKRYFRTKQDLKQHIQTHNVDKLYTCKVCTKNFKTENSLKQHTNVHNGVKHSCDMCKKSFRTKHNLRGHLLIHSNEKLYNCNVCNKGFNRKTHLKRHMYTHTDEKPHNCVVCMKAHATKHDLKLHMYKHTGERPYNCVVCRKGFVTSTCLKLHMRIHNGEKHTCNVCNECFKSVKKLKQHTNVHHPDERPYNCVVCQKGFVTSTCLKLHMRIHNGEKHKCNEYFKSIKKLNQHTNIHVMEQTDNKGNKCMAINDSNKVICSPEKLYSCDACKKYFIKDTHLKRHKCVNTNVWDVD